MFCSRLQARRTKQGANFNFLVPRYKYSVLFLCNKFHDTQQHHSTAETHPYAQQINENKTTVLKGKQTWNEKWRRKIFIRCTIYELLCVYIPKFPINIEQRSRIEYTAVQTDRDEVIPDKKLTEWMGKSSFPFWRMRSTQFSITLKA